MPLYLISQESSNYTGLYKYQMKNEPKNIYYVSFDNGLMDRHIPIYDQNERKKSEFISQGEVLNDVNDSSKIAFRLDTLFSKAENKRGIYLNFNNSGKLVTYMERSERTYVLKGTFTTYYSNGKIYCTGLIGNDGYFKGFINYYDKKGNLIVSYNLSQFECGSKIIFKNPFDPNYKQKKYPIFVSCEE